MVKCCKKCNRIFDDEEKFCSRCGQKLVKLDFKEEKVKIEAYYRKMFVGTNTDIVTLENNHLVVRFKDSLKAEDKVFARICDMEKCDSLEYNISIRSSNGPELVLRMTPKKDYLSALIYDVRVCGFITSKNIERFKKYKGKEAVQAEVNHVQYEIERTGEMASIYKEEKKKWAKSLKLLEKVKEMK